VSSISFGDGSETNAIPSAVLTGLDLGTLVRGGAGGAPRPRATCAPGPLAEGPLPAL
jgi:hypothetical protein